MRTTGDEKVYIAQAIEMQQANRWFLQTLANEPNYYKGPLHYILIRIGFIIFGNHSLWAALWMNVFFLTLSSMTLYAALFKLTKTPELSFFTSLALVTAPGVFSHMFASQMEIELVGIYSFVMAGFMLSDSRTVNRLDLITWILIGFASWVKSPLHSLLLAFSAFIYLFLNSSLRIKLINARYISYLFIGILVGVSGYIVPLLYDFDNFLQTYILRESISKGSNGVGIIESFLPTYSYQIGFWAAIILPGLFFTCRKAIHNRLAGNDAKIISAAFAICLPTTVFFIIHPYRGAIYTIPVLPAVITLGFIGYSPYFTERFRHKKKILITSICLALIPNTLIATLYSLIFPTNLLTDPIILVTIFGTIALTLAIYYRRHQIFKSIRIELIYFTIALFSLLPALLIMKKIGEFEIKALSQYKENKDDPELVYANIDKFLWSEWGLLNLSFGGKVLPAHEQHQLVSYLQSGHPVIIDNVKHLKMIEKDYPSLFASLKINTWKRWKKHIAFNQQIIKNAAQPSYSRNLDLMLRESYIVVKKTAISQARSPN